jgi:hypothetical protein
MVGAGPSTRGVRDRTGPKDAATPRSRLANDAVVIEGGPHLAAKLRTNGATGHRAILPGRAPDVPYTSVRSGHPRTTTVGAQTRRAVGSGRAERAEGASQARGSSPPWSPLGPHGIRNRWSSVGTSGHARQVESAGHRRSTATTTDSETASDRVQTPHPAAAVGRAGAADPRQRPVTTDNSVGRHPGHSTCQQITADPRSALQLLDVVSLLLTG